MNCKNCKHFAVFHCSFHNRTFSLEELVVIADGGLPEWCKKTEEEGEE